MISNKKWGYILRTFFNWTEKHNWVVYETRVVHFGTSGSHKLVSSFPMCDFLLYSHMLSRYYNKQYNNAIREHESCVIIIPESPPCDLQKNRKRDRQKSWKWYRRCSNAAQNGVCPTLFILIILYCKHILLLKSQDNILKFIVKPPLAVEYNVPYTILIIEKQLG